MFILVRNIILKKHNPCKEIMKQVKLLTKDFKRWEDRCYEVQGKAEILISKQRHGPTGLIQLQFNQSLQDF